MNERSATLSLILYSTRYWRGPLAVFFHFLIIAFSCLRHLSSFFYFVPLLRFLHLSSFSMRSNIVLSSFSCFFSLFSPQYSVLSSFFSTQTFLIKTILSLRFLLRQKVLYILSIYLVFLRSCYFYFPLCYLRLFTSFFSPSLTNSSSLNFS